MYNILELNNKYLIELREIAQSMGVERTGIMKKPDLIFTILNLQPVVIATPKQWKTVEPANFIVMESPERKVSNLTDSFSRQPQHWLSAILRYFRLF